MRLLMAGIIKKYVVDNVQKDVRKVKLAIYDIKDKYIHCEKCYRVIIDAWETGKTVCIDCEPKDNKK